MSITTEESFEKIKKWKHIQVTYSLLEKLLTEEIHHDSTV